MEHTVVNGLFTVTAYAHRELEGRLPDVTKIHFPALTRRDYDVFRLLVMIGFELTFKVDDPRIITLTEELIDCFGATDGQETFDPATRIEHQAVFGLVDTSMDELDEWYSGALSILETAMAFYSPDQPDPLIDSLFVKMLQQRMRLREQPNGLKH